MMKTFLPAFSLFLVACAAPQPASDFDLVLSGGSVYSGEDTEPVVTDIGIRGDRIVSVGDLSARSAGKRIDVAGLAVAPGFIDIHSHAIRGSDARSGLINHPDAENYIRQGVTTAIGGPDGGSRWPIDSLLDELDKLPMTINFGTFVGHNTIREAVMQREDRAPTDEELNRMLAMVDQAMHEGAFGLSTGLKYIPGNYARTDEVIKLARIAGHHGGIHISHMREEGLGLLKSVAETIEIGEQGGLPTQLTHHKVVGKPMHWQSKLTLGMVDEALSRGVDVSIDQYPYTASSTGLGILFPGWSQAGGQEALVERLNNPDTRRRIKQAIERNILVDRGGGHPSNIVIADCPFNSDLNGKSLAEILEEKGAHVRTEVAAELVMELMELGGCMTVYHAMSEEDVKRIMQHPRTMIASDGGIHVAGEGMPHPRNYGAFARVLGHYSRDEQVIPLHTAIHKMTAMPADRIGLANRGRLKEGMIADIAVFDPTEVRDTATFENPHQYAEGMTHVFVSGKAVLLKGEMTGARPGKVLRHAR